MSVCTRVLLFVALLQAVAAITDWKKTAVVKRKHKLRSGFGPEPLAHSGPCACIPLARCPELVRLLSSHPVHPATVDFLTNQTCGFDGFEPYVCCWAGRPPVVPQPRVERCMPTTGPDNSLPEPGTERMFADSPAEPDFPSRFGGFHPMRHPPRQHPTPHHPHHHHPDYFGPRPFHPAFDRSTSSPPIFVEDEEPSGSDIVARTSVLPDESCGLALDQRIVGGQDAKLGAYPWIARLGYTRLQSTTYLYRCGATLINKRYVLSAAHCVKNLPGELKLATVRLGELDERSSPDCDEDECADEPQDFAPITVVVHRDYNTPRYKHDIALIKLDRDARITPYVTPICLPQESMGASNYTGAEATVAGWGVTNLALPASSPILQDLKLKISDRLSCNLTYSSRFQLDVGQDQFCTTGGRDKDACEGDSGGPLMSQEQLEENGVPRFYLIGIVSFGPRQCGTQDIPGVYTRVSSYLTWILRHLD